MKLKGYRTLIFNGLAALPIVALELLPVVMPVLSLPELRAVLPEEWLPWWVLITALGNMVLRRVTDTPIGRDRA
ncbi:hypothetical protein [Roseinatronobacter sp.]